MSEVANELRELRKEVVRLNRKISLGRLPGTVVERDAAKRMVRLDLGADPDTGEVVKSPWVRVGSTQTGAFKSFSLPSIGQQMYLDSASGVIGADSVATAGTFTDGNAHPTQAADEAVLLEHGDVRIAMKQGVLSMKSAGSSFELKATGPAFTGGKITHDGKNVGGDHKHKDVEPGGGQSGPPTE